MKPRTGLLLHEFGLARRGQPARESLSDLAHCDFPQQFCDLLRWNSVRNFLMPGSQTGASVSAVEDTLRG
jgi:hypothetical protein